MRTAMMHDDNFHRLGTLMMQTDQRLLQRLLDLISEARANLYAQLPQNAAMRHIDIVLREAEQLLICNIKEP